MGSFEDQRDNVGEGWQPLLTDLHQRLLALDPGYEVSLIKEKFGGLRYYISHIEDITVAGQVNDLIAEAEEASYHLCEECGMTGKLRTDRSWVRTLCDAHA